MAVAAVPFLLFVTVVELGMTTDDDLALVPPPPPPMSSLIDTKLTRKWPHFVEVAPCPCDLTPEACDTFCCCDQDCPEEVRGNQSHMSCWRGHRGGLELPGFHVNDNCSLSAHLSWLQKFPTFPLSCVASMNSPFLGSFFRERDLLPTRAHFDEAVNPVKTAKEDTKSDFEDRNVQFVDEMRAEAAYVYRTALKTTHDVESGIFGTLKLPQNTFNGECIPSPVRYLQPVESSCSLQLTPDVCSSGLGTSLDYQTFLNPTDKSDILLQEFGSAKGAAVDVRYFTTNLSAKYVKLFGKHPPVPEFHSEDNLDELAVLLANSKPSKPDQQFGGKYFDHDLRPILSLKPRKRLHYDPATESCVNVVLEVEYEIVWNGTRIDKINANVLIGDLLLRRNENVPKIVLNQHFKAAFLHASEIIGNNEVLHRSGEPGYDTGRPLIAGELLNDAYIVQNETALKSWRPGVFSLCRDAKVDPIAFGVNLRTGCVLNLLERDFANCQSLKRSVLDLQNALVSAEFIAKGGNPDFEFDSDFVRVIQSENETMIGVSGGKSLRPSCFVPSVLKVEITYSEGESDAKIKRINGVRVKREWEELAWKCQRKVGRVCDRTQPYEMVQIIAFESIPIVWHHQNTSRFWVIQEQTPCEGDICWKELMYPFTHQTTGDMIDYVTQWGGVMLLTLVLTLVITKDSW